MSKKLSAAITLGVMCLASTTAYAWDQKTWQLPKDVLGTSNQISFNQGANGVWYFMESSSLSHNPLTYRFFPNFTSPCVGAGSFVTGVGVECWGDLSGRDQSPKAPLNASSSQNGEFPTYTLALAPSNVSLSIVGWVSPIDGEVNVTGSYSEIETCATGVVWSVDKGSAILKSGVLLSGSVSFNLPKLRVKSGEVLYFTIDPYGNQSCDTTAFQATIADQSDQR
jgi:hypothetical protein